DVAEGRIRVLHRDTGAELWSADLTPFHGRGTLYSFVQPNYPCSCRVVGHLAFFEIGTEVIGLDLIERRVRWSRKVQEDGQAPTAILPYVQDGTLEYLSEWAVGAGISPVGPECLCVRVRPGLSVLNPATGEVRWTRTDVPSALELFGDAERLYLAERNVDGTVRGIRAF